MIIVQGTFHLAADQRDDYLAQLTETQRISRSEPGCLEYVFAPDPLADDRVVLSERWTSRADLDAHLAALRDRRAAGADPQPVQPQSSELVFFEATAIELDA